MGDTCKHTALVHFPKWTDEMRDALTAAGMRTAGRADETFTNGEAGVSVELHATGEVDARMRIREALRHWVQLAYADFGPIVPVST